MRTAGVNRSTRGGAAGSIHDPCLVTLVQSIEVQSIETEALATLESQLRMARALRPSDTDVDTAGVYTIGSANGNPLPVITTFTTAPVEKSTEASKLNFSIGIV